MIKYLIFEIYMCVYIYIYIYVCVLVVDLFGVFVWVVRVLEPNALNMVGKYSTTDLCS
jgi:hypothetical protein